ncbi:lipocalin-like domain-containing protein [Streptosporangium sp. NBC_01755]|uniref:lipocalin-like domain-containing protein n=1 Tax=unclassified Streptosporangium TaxID=2632669 RepID=UPI002DD8135A|nr:MULTISPECIES: lipocalin-like domain-containing protein [unclassified Streptosporangium]WSA23601.1 lipocalin-like domain-containing protein [Streptosporangium sp. NBC_01810]WSC98191.1 lipocalin-like domain-containing protein [Streptosporangium sp. NBC_01755]
MDLVGAWRLVEWRIVSAVGRVSHPIGTDAVGLLCYTPDGRMSVTIARRSSLAVPVRRQSPEVTRLACGSAGTRCRRR